MTILVKFLLVNTFLFCILACEHIAASAELGQCVIIPYNAASHTQGITDILKSTEVDGHSLQYWLAPVETVFKDLNNKDYVSYVLTDEHKQSVGGFITCYASKNCFELIKAKKKQNPKTAEEKYWFVEWLAVHSSWSQKEIKISTQEGYTAVGTAAHVLYAQAERDAQAKKLPIMSSVTKDYTSMIKFCGKVGMRFLGAGPECYYVGDRHLQQNMRSETLTGAAASFAHEPITTAQFSSPGENSFNNIPKSAILPASTSHGNVPSIASSYAYHNALYIGIGAACVAGVLYYFHKPIQKKLKKSLKLQSSGPIKIEESVL